MYKGIKFYSNYDLTIGYNINLANEILQEYDINNIEYDVNEIIEFYNIIKFFDNNLFIQEEKVKYSLHLKSMKKMIGIFFSKLNDNIIINIYDLLDKIYYDDFWEALSEHLGSVNVSSDIIEIILRKDNVHIFQIIKNKKIVTKYSCLIKDFMISYPCKTAELLLDEYEVKHNNEHHKLYFPLELNVSEKEQILKKYILNNDSNPNYLRLLTIMFNKPNILEISDKTRLLAVEKLQEKNENLFSNNTGISHSVSISFLDSVKNSLKYDDFNLHVIYNKEWISNNLDYPTLLNNFIYLFEFVDNQMRFNHANKANELGIFERHLMYSINEYVYGVSYSHKQMLLLLQMKSYYNELALNKIVYEDIIKWFFEEYLINEFNAKGFKISTPSNNLTYFEKCRIIFPEIDGILKQFDLFVEEGIVERKLYELRWNSIPFEKINSLLDKKYLYPHGANYNIASHLLFSDQCMLHYIKGKKTYNSFFELIINEDIKKEDYPSYQLRDLQWLINNQFIHSDENCYLKLTNINKVKILRDLYWNDVISFYNYPKHLQFILDELLMDGYATTNKTLLSKPESDFIDFYLNKRLFNNGLDLRNKYLHATQATQDQDEIHERNYMIALTILTIIIIKINDEFCLLDSLNKTL